MHDRVTFVHSLILASFYGSLIKRSFLFLISSCLTSETIQRDFSPPNQRNVYDPWGGSGAGAPIRDLDGQIQTRTAGKVSHDVTVSTKIFVDIKHMYDFLNLSGSELFLMPYLPLYLGPGWGNSLLWAI